MSRLLLALFACLVPTLAHGSVVVPRSLPQMVSDADMVVEAVNQGQTSRWETLPELGERIVTYTDLTVTDGVGAAAGRRLRVRTLGGRVGDIVQRVFGQADLRPGSRQLLFLRRSSSADLFVVVSGAEGAYRVDTTDGHPRLRPALQELTLLRSPGAAPAVDRLTGLAVHEALRLVREQWRKIGRP